MDIHVIKLRGGWECDAPGGPGITSARRSLPVRAETLPAGRLRLTRRFNRPPREPGSTVLLRLSRCPGIHSLTYNGRPLHPISPDRSDFELGLGQLAASNELVIEAEPPRGEVEWGLISLVFTSRASGTPESAGPGVGRGSP